MSTTAFLNDNQETKRERTITKSREKVEAEEEEWKMAG